MPEAIRRNVMPATINNLAALWGKLSNPNDLIWNSSPPHNQKRYLLEQLSGTLWHLEKSFEMGNLIETKFGALRAQYPKVPWAYYIERKLGNKTDKCPEAEKYVFQTMMIAAAAVRIDGIRDVMGAVFIEEPYRRRNSDKDEQLYNGKEVLANRLYILDKWLKINKEQSVYEFKDDLSNDDLGKIKKQVTKVILFRDAYMHGVISNKGLTGWRKEWVEFRENYFLKLSFPELVDACEQVCMRLLRLLCLM